MKRQGAKRLLNSAHREQGFTLVEMLVALALIGLLSLGLASATGLGIRAWTTTDSTSAQVDLARASHAALRQIISRIYPEWTGRNPSHVDFYGTSEEMRFLSPTPRALGYPGLARINLLVLEQDGSSSLILRARPDIGDDAPARTSETVLVSNAKTIEFSYFGTGETSVTQVWQTGWQTRSDLPRLIRIEITPKDSKSLAWPTLIVKPMIDVDVSCEFDPLTHRCRGR